MARALIRRSRRWAANRLFRNAIKVTKPGGTISNAGYHGKGDYVGIPRLDWGVGMAEKAIRTGLCPGGRLRMERLIRCCKPGASIDADDDPYVRVSRARQSVRDYGQEARRGHETIDRFLIVLSAGTDGERKLASVHQFDYFGTAPFDFGTMPIGHRSQ